MIVCAGAVRERGDLAGNLVASMMLPASARRPLTQVKSRLQPRIAAPELMLVKGCPVFGAILSRPEGLPIK